jgi:hypothetical protein
VVAFHYSAFGLKIQSDIRLIPPLLEEQFSEPPDCELHFGAAPEPEVASKGPILTYASAYRDAAGAPALRIWQINDGAYSRLDYSDGHQFWLDRKGTRVWAVWPNSSTIEEVTSYLLGPVLGVLLRYRGVICLHASAVSINGRAVAFLGAPGAGKSTIAAALAQRGHLVLADDITALEERSGVIYAQPAYPGVCLWPESMALLYRDLPETAPLSKQDKRRISSHEGLRFESRPLPLHRIYLLAYQKSCLEASISAISPRSLLLSLAANTYANSVLDNQGRAREFSILGRIASAVQGRTLKARRDENQIDICCRLITADAVLR